jgi:hypothetical protein
MKTLCYNEVQITFALTLLTCSSGPSGRPQKCGSTCQRHAVVQIESISPEPSSTVRPRIR